jgi:nucleoside-diphosphate-sugar epimerase
MTTLIIGAGLVGSQVARILVEQGERPVVMDRAAQPEAIGQIVESSRVTLIEGDILRPLTLTKAFRDHGITGIIHTAANPMLTLGALPTRRSNSTSWGRSTCSRRRASAASNESWSRARTC